MPFQFSSLGLAKVEANSHNEKVQSWPNIHVYKKVYVMSVNRSS
jgi:hypothetical protein